MNDEHGERLLHDNRAHHPVAFDYLAIAAYVLMVIMVVANDAYFILRQELLLELGGAILVHLGVFGFPALGYTVAYLQGDFDEDSQRRLSDYNE